MKNKPVVDYITLRNKSKKGFTLVELVVVIAILATVAAIAIPIVTYELHTSKKNAAVANARTIEYAIKEAKAAQSVGDTTLYTNIKTTPVKISDVASKKGIKDTFKPVDYLGTTYTPAWSDGKVYFVNGTSTIDGLTLTTKTDLTAN